MIRPIVSLAAVALLAACAQAPISANPTSTALDAIGKTPIGGLVTQGLLDSEWNLDQAIKIGALSANDPADACLHSTLTTLGIEPTAAGATPTPPPASFVPKVSDLISSGSVAYILAQQAKTAISNNVIVVPPACKALIGQIVIDAGTATAKTLPSILVGPANLLPTIQ